MSSYNNYANYALPSAPVRVQIAQPNPLPPMPEPTPVTIGPGEDQDAGIKAAAADIRQNGMPAYEKLMGYTPDSSLTQAQNETAFKSYMIETSQNSVSGGEGINPDALSKGPGLTSDDLNYIAAVSGINQSGASRFNKPVPDAEETRLQASEQPLYDAAVLDIPNARVKQERRDIANSLPADAAVSPNFDRMMAASGLPTPDPSQSPAERQAAEKDFARDTMGLDGLSPGGQFTASDLRQVLDHVVKDPNTSTNGIAYAARAEGAYNELDRQEGEQRKAEYDAKHPEAQNTDAPSADAPAASAPDAPTASAQQLPSADAQSPDANGFAAMLQNANFSQNNQYASQDMDASSAAANKSPPSTPDVSAPAQEQSAAL